MASGTASTPSPKAYELALRWFLSLNIFYFLLGTGLVVFYQQIRIDRHIHYVLYSYSDYRKGPVFLDSIAAAIMAATGFVGIVLRFYDRPFYFNTYESFLFVSVSLNVVGSATAAIIPARIIKSRYETSFAAELLHMTNHGRFIPICHNKHMWDIIQRDIHCCGLSDPRDWIMSNLNNVPKSCCNKKKHPKECMRWSDIGVKLGKDLKVIHEQIYPNLYNISCIQRFQELTATRKTIWTSVPLIVAFLQAIFIAYTSYIVETIRVYCNYRATENEKVKASNPELAKLKAKQKKRRVIPESEKTSMNSIP